MSNQPILIAGQWRQADAASTFQAKNPNTGETLPEVYPLSAWADIDEALDAAKAAFEVSRSLPGAKLADFLEAYADLIDANTDALAQQAHIETGLLVTPRLAGIEIPRTTDQLRQAASAARTSSWAAPTIDTASGLRSMMGPLGTVCVFGPNNFPFAFNGVSGGDFASAIAAGNPVIAKAHPSHPQTTRMLAELCLQAIQATGMPLGLVQMVYRMTSTDGLKLMADPRNSALGYTGARKPGLALKKAGDDTGKLSYLELSSTNPVVMLPGALAERGPAIADEYAGSCLMGAGQFCTNPGLVIAVQNDDTDAFIATVSQRFADAPVGTLLNQGVEDGLSRVISELKKSGAKLLVGGQAEADGRCSYANTLLSVDGDAFLADPESLQAEAFGNSALIVLAKDTDQVHAILKTLEGNLTGCIYSANDGSDDATYDQLVPELRQHVGRLLNDKMPTGVAVVAAQNHGGPYPSTGHPGFSAVGFPGSMQRFAMLQSFDNVRQHRLPAILQDANPTGQAWRLIDGQWSQADVTSA